MATITEDNDSLQASEEKGGKKSLIRTFTVYDADSPNEAILLAPPYGSRYSDMGVYLRSKSAVRVPEKSGMFRVKAVYDSPDPINNPPVDYVFWSMDIATQTQKIFNVKSTSDRTEYPTTLRWYGRTTINEDDEGNIDGVDVMIPKVQLTARVLRKKSYWTNAYIQSVNSLIAKVNDAKFQGFEAGEVIFIGCQKDDSGEDYVNLTYQFLCEKNQTEINFQSNEPNFKGDYSVDKKGWEYFWVRNGKYYDSETKESKTGALVANVDKVYETGDLSALDLTDSDSEITDDTDYGIL